MCIFTPSEAAGVAVVYSLFVTMVVHREVGLRELWAILQSSVFLISQILMIVTAAGLYSWLLTTSGMPQAIVAHVESLHMPVWALLLSINVILLIMGSFLEPPAAIVGMVSIPGMPLRSEISPYGVRGKPKVCPRSMPRFPGVRS